MESSPSTSSASSPKKTSKTQNPAQNEIQPKQLPNQEPKFTHFLSIPFTTEEFKNNLQKVQNQLLRFSDKADLPYKLFQKPEKLHITLSMLSLANEEDENRARECLNECKEKFIDPVMQGEPLTLTATGLNIFSDKNPTSARVVFAEIQSEKMQKIAEDVSEYFIEKGLVKRQKHGVKLHLTIMNASFVKHIFVNGKRRPFRKFDATSVLKNFGDFHFGTLKVEEIRISCLGEKDETGYYKSIGMVKL